MGRLLSAALALVAALTVGALVASGYVAVAYGPSRSPAVPPAVFERVAERAEHSADRYLGGPFTRVLVTYGTTAVLRTPGSCDQPSLGDSLSEYAAVLRGHTLFAVPVWTAYATCGGESVSLSRSPAG